MEHGKITLGDKHFKVPALTIGQLRALQPIVDGAVKDGALEFGKAGTCAAILAVALRRAEPPVENIDDIAADLPELHAAVRAILILSGFIGKDANPGEAGAE